MLLNVTLIIQSKKYEQFRTHPCASKIAFEIDQKMYTGIQKSMMKKSKIFLFVLAFSRTERLHYLSVNSEEEEEYIEKLYQS